MSQLQYDLSEKLNLTQYVIWIPINLDLTYPCRR